MTPQMAAHIEATPMTVAMHIHSWLLECVSSIHKNQQNFNTPSTHIKKSPYTGLSLTTKLEEYASVLSLSEGSQVSRKLNELVKIVGGTISSNIY